MYPKPNVPRHGKSLLMGYNPQECLENPINTMGTLLGVHPIVSWPLCFQKISAGVQLLHEEDPCCFHACGRHARIQDRSVVHRTFRWLGKGNPEKRPNLSSDQLGPVVICCHLWDGTTHLYRDYDESIIRMPIDPAVKWHVSQEFWKLLILLSRFP